MARSEQVVGVDRLLAFGDAVFAIAITLLTLDLTVPDGLSTSDFNKAMRTALPSIGIYVLTFAVIGALWLAHHGLFRLVGSLDGWLVRLDLAFLAVIAALPFPARLLSEYGSTPLGTSVYAAAIALASALTSAMAFRLMRDPTLRAKEITRGRVVVAMQRAGAITVVFGTSIPVSLLSPDGAKYWWLLAVPLRWRLDRDEDKPLRFGRRPAEQHPAEQPAADS
ncbi:TMEM175 family protein [Streptacidiphilus sp. PAMC 29251]